jgi:Domain of unknown function (DUF756)
MQPRPIVDPLSEGIAAEGLADLLRTEEGGALSWRIRNFGETKASVVVLDAYTGNHVVELLRPDEEIKDDWSSTKLFGWYDLVVTVVEDPTFSYRLAGHIEPDRTGSRTLPRAHGGIHARAYARRVSRCRRGFRLQVIDLTDYYRRFDAALNSRIIAA